MLGATDDQTLMDQIDEEIQFEIDFEKVSVWFQKWWNISPSFQLDLSPIEKQDPSSLYKFAEITELPNEFPGVSDQYSDDT